MSNLSLAGGHSLRHVRTALRRHDDSSPVVGKDFASVAIVLCEHGSEPNLTPHVLLIERALHPSDPWSGHLAFPGGRQDASDADLLATAVRETHEEVGLVLNPATDLLGKIAPIAARGAGRPGLVVQPFVFEIPHQTGFIVNPSEVARAFWVPVAPLLRGEHDTFIEIERANARFRLPGYQVDTHVLWGMTYEMFRALARVCQWLQ